MFWQNIVGKLWDMEKKRETLSGKNMLIVYEWIREGDTYSGTEIQNREE